MTLVRLAHPPLVEVVCGIRFDRVPRIDAVMIGEYRLRRGEPFTRYEIQPLLQDEGEFLFGPPAQRVWLLSDDDQFVLQFQHDRFFHNWRKRHEEYPRFSDHDGATGLLHRTLSEWSQFDEFSARSLGRRIRPTRIELAKIDHLVEGRHWSDRSDLLTLMPALSGTFQIGGGEEKRAIHVRVIRPLAGGQLTVSIATLQRVSSAESPNLIAVETRYIKPLDPDSELKPAFVEANEIVNSVFEGLIAPEQLRRFNTTP